MKKRTFNITICLLTSLLVIACGSNMQTIEVTRTVEQTSVIIQSPTPITTSNPASTVKPANPPEITPTPLQTSIFTETPFIKSTQKSPTLTSRQVEDKIAACYPVSSGCSACNSKLNNSVQRVVGTTRMFINAPKDLYPMELFRFATTINGNATMGYISNGGLPGYAMDGSPECWSTYVEFDGQGEIDLRIPSILSGVPDYYVRFIVE